MCGRGKKRHGGSHRVLGTAGSGGEPSVGITFNVTVNYAMLVEDIDCNGDLLRIQPDDMLLKSQPRHLL